MRFIKISDGSVHTLDGVKSLENVSMSDGCDDLRHIGYERLYETPMPVEYGFNSVEDGVEFSNGVWKTRWVLVKKTDDELRIAAKNNRQNAVDSITVAIQDGRVFDGDEMSTTRMGKAITVLTYLAEQFQAGAPVDLSDYGPAYSLTEGIYRSIWVLADNTPTYVTVGALKEALALAGATQASIWVLP